MTYLVDTDWIVEYMKGREPATTVLTRLRHAGLSISLITFGEIYEGIYSGRAPAAQEAVFLHLLRRVPVLALNRSILREFARIRGQLRAEGQLIGDFDILIAATALYHDLTVITHNARHFARVPGLKIYQQAS